MEGGTMSGTISVKSSIGEVKKRAFSPLAGLKVVTASGWFAVRPSGTENVYKIYAESFRDQPALGALLNEAQRIVDNALS
jgi:phosphoglucomutase